MRLRTRVLSFMLAGSMMLSATPVSAFAETPVLGEGTVSPTALSETNSTDGVYDSRVDGSHELRCTGGIFTDTQDTIYKNAIYVVNQNSAPAAKLKFTPPDGHSIVAWRIDMGTAWGYNDATNSKVQMLLKAANLKCSADNTELTFTCPGSITYGEKTYPAFVADASLTPVLNITAADLLFEKGTIVLGNELSSGSGITATLVYYSVTDGVKGSEAMTARPTKPGQYQIAVKLSVDGASATDKYANRVKCGNVYYQVDPSQELTSEKWRYRVVSSSVNLTVNENGEPVVPSGTAGVKYADGVLTIYPRFVVHFGVNDIVKCDIVNEGKLDGGIFTGTVTNKGVIESGMFVNKPENANSVKFSFTSGTTFCGLNDRSGTTSLYIVCTGNGSYPQLSASYSNPSPSRKPFGWLVAVTSPSFKGTSYGPMTADWTMVSPMSTALSEQLYDAVAVYTPVAYMDSSDLSIDSTGKVNISIPEVEATGVTYTNTVTKETFTSYPTAAGSYTAHVSLECTRNWDFLASQSPVIPASALLADDGVAALSEEQENPLRRIALKGDLYYYVPETLDVDVTVKQSTPASTVVTLTVDENGAPVIPADAKGVRYESHILTIDPNTTAQFAQGSIVKCSIVNNGTLDGGLFTGTVTGSGSIARGLFLHDPKAASPTMMLSVPENASLNGITAPDATGLTTLYAVNALDGENNELLFIGDYIGTDPHTFYGWDLVYSLGDEENSDVEKNYIGHTHFEQPMYGPIPDGMNGVRCIFLPVLEMDASDLTITADKTESKITGAVIESVQYVDKSDPNAAPSSVYPTKAGKYKAIVTLTCPGDSTYSKARVARIGHLCYHVPETLEVEVTVEREPVQPELSIVNGLPDTTGMEADAEGVYTSKNWSYNKNTNTLSVTNSSYFETFTGLVSCKVVAGEGVKISNGYFMDTVTFEGGTVDGGWFAKEPVGCDPSAVHSIAYADGTTEFTVNKTLTVTKIWYGGPLKVNISTETPIYSVGKNYLPHQTTSLDYTSEYPTDYVLNSLPAPVLSTFTLSGVTDAYVMLDTTYRLDMTDPQELHEGVQVTVKADACDADHQVEWVATGLELSEEQKHSAELTFTMPGNDVTLTATYPSIHKVPTTDSEGNVTIPEGTDEVKGDGWTAKKDEEGKTTVEITDSTNLNNTTLNCDKITIGSAETSTTVSNLTTNADVTVASGSAIKGGTFSGDVSGTGTIEGGTFTGTVDSSVTVTGGVFTEKAAENLNAQTTPVTVTGGASINNIKNESGSEDNKTTVQVVGEPQLSLAYTPDTGRTFYGWQKDADIIVKGENTNNTNVKVDSNDSEPVYTPVVKLIKDDLDNFNLTEVFGTEGYYQVVDGELTGDCLGNELPTEPGTYALGVKLANAESTENTIALALYADETASVGNRVLMKDGVGYYVPELLQVGDSITVGGSDAATGSGDSGAGGAAVAVIGGAAIGGAAYLIGTQVYLTSVLPEGASIPTNRQQLADLLWTAAGKPQPASTALFTDISADAADSQKAARWCVEQGLLKDTGSTFKPDKHTFRPQVIKAWNDLQAKLNPQK